MILDCESCGAVVERGDDDRICRTPIMDETCVKRFNEMRPLGFPARVDGNCLGTLVPRPSGDATGWGVLDDLQHDRAVPDWRSLTPEQLAALRELVATQPASSPDAGDDETLDVPMPSVLRVMVYRSTQWGAPCWIIKVGATAKNVITGAIEDFGLEVKTLGADQPSREKVAMTVLDWLAHEVAEQFGMKPHEHGREPPPLLLSLEQKQALR